jgi:hypothetical protein
MHWQIIKNLKKLATSFHIFHISFHFIMSDTEEAPAPKTSKKRSASTSGKRSSKSSSSEEGGTKRRKTGDGKRKKAAAADEDADDAPKEPVRIMVQMREYASGTGKYEILRKVPRVNKEKLKEKEADTGKAASDAGKKDKRQGGRDRNAKTITKYADELPLSGDWQIETIDPIGKLNVTAHVRHLESGHLFPVQPQQLVEILTRHVNIENIKWNGTAVFMQQSSQISVGFPNVPTPPPPVLLPPSSSSSSSSSSSVPAATVSAVVPVVPAPMPAANQPFA